MKKQIVADAIVYLISMVVAMLLNLLVSALLETIFASLGLDEYFGRAIVRITSGFLVGAGVLGALVYRECHKDMLFMPSILIPSIALAGIGQMALALVFRFNPILSGGVRDLAGILSFGSGFDSVDKIEKIPLPMGILAFFMYLLFEIGICVWLGYLGKKNREKSREDLINPESGEKVQ